MIGNLTHICILIVIVREIYFAPKVKDYQEIDRMYSIRAHPPKSVAFCNFGKAEEGSDLVRAIRGRAGSCLDSEKHCHSISSRERPLQQSFTGEDTFL